MPVLIHTPLCSFIPPKRSFLPPRAKIYPPALICTTPAIVYSTTIENVIALLMPMMSYNYLIWVGRSPARLISFFRPSVQNFSGEPPLHCCVIWTGKCVPETSTDTTMMLQREERM